MINNSEYRLLFALGMCNHRLRVHKVTLESRPKVTEATHWSDIEIVDEAFRLKEFVDAELINGQAISWRLEVTVTPHKIAVEADVRRIHSEGIDVLVEIANYCFDNVTVASNRITDITEQLCAVDPIKDTVL